MLFGPILKAGVDDDELVSIDTLEASFEKRILKSYKQFLLNVRSPNMLREARQHLSDISWIIGHIDQKIQPTGFLLNELFNVAGRKEAAVISAKLGKRVIFDPLDPITLGVQKDNRLSFINEFNRKQRLVSRETLLEAKRRRLNAEDTFKALQTSVGLTAHQERIVNNYRRLLEKGSTDALERTLRDRKFDGVLSRSLKGGEPLTNKQIDRMSEAYRTKFKAYRAANIARTEALKAANNARYMAHKQAASQGMSEDTVIRTWHSMEDEKVRDTHEELNGQQVEGMDEPFESDSGALLMFPGDPTAPADEIVNCRCFVTYRMRRAKR